MFTGGSQFAFVSIIGTGGLAAAPAAIATASMLGIRNGLYGLQTSRFLGVSGVRRIVAAHLTIDESTAVGIAQPELRAQRLGFWQTGLAVFVLWNLSTLAGALLGNAFGDPRTLGLDAAAAAAFVALLWPRLRSRDATATAVLAMFIALLTSPVLPAGVPVILAAAAALVVGLRHPGRHEGPLEGADGSLPGIGPDAMTLWVAVVDRLGGVAAHQARGLPRPRDPARRRAHLPGHHPAAGGPARGPRRGADGRRARAARSCSTPGSSPSASPSCCSCCGRTSSSSCSRPAPPPPSCARSAGAGSTAPGYASSAAR